MSDRIEKTFADLKTENRAALIPFIMGCDPDAQTTSALLDALAAQGADLIEIGMPFSDPMADGPVIQAAGKRALAAGATVSGILELVKLFRNRNEKTPVILMGYFNPVYCYGSEKFCKDASAAGVDGVILVDLPPEEEQEIKPHLENTGLKLIRLVAPTSGATTNDKNGRLPLLAASASGFIYYISITGITGAKLHLNLAADASALKSQIDHLRTFSTLPIAVGFGIKTAEQVKQVAAFSDAVVVGSALVDVIEKSKNKVKDAGDFIAQLAKGL